MHCPTCADANATRLPSRRSIIAGFACLAVAPTAVPRRRMRPRPPRTSASCASRSKRRGSADFPFGAVIVRDGIETRARAQSRPHELHDPTAHGEMDAIRNCVAEHGGGALRGSTLYTTGEPCAMCMGAILWSHVGRLVFAASFAQLSTKMNQIMITSAELAAKAPFAPIKITGGVLAGDAMKLFG